MIETYSGFVQVQHKNYQDDMVLENSLAFSAETLSNLEKLKSIKSVSPRIESFALASNGQQTKGAVIIGIDADRESQLSDPQHLLVKFRISEKTIDSLIGNKIPVEIINKVKEQVNESFSSRESFELALNLEEADLNKWIIKILEFSKFNGTILQQDDDGVLVSDRLSKYLKANIGDTIILIGQGYQGISAAELFPVRGIIKIPAPDLDNKLIYMPLAKAQSFFGMEGRLTSININPNDNSERNLPLIKTEISALLNNPDIVIKGWKEFNPILKQQIEGDNQSGQAILGLLYFIIFFGIFGTVIMMVHERSREFGVLISIGMQRSSLTAIFLYEMLIMGFMAVIIGILMSLPILYYGSVHPFRFTGDLAKVYSSMGFEPVMPMMWIDAYIFWQGFIVVLMVFLSCLYTLRKIFILKEVNALRT
jgi:ABC-type lipoprotein release transport system permease subunit